MQIYKFFANYATRGEKKEEEKKKPGFQIRTPATLFFSLGEKGGGRCIKIPRTQTQKREEKKKRKTKNPKKIHEDTLFNSIINMGTVRGRDPT